MIQQGPRKTPSQLLGQFDTEIVGMMFLGDPRDAIEFAKKHASHALVKAAEIALRSFAEEEHAISLLDTARTLDPKNIQTYEKLALLYAGHSNYKKVLFYTQAGLDVQETATLFHQQGLAERYIDRLEDAMKTFRRWVELEPENPVAHYELSDVLLLLGQFPEALKEGEWRFQASDWGKRLMETFDKPLWDGKADLKGKRVLLFNEQGRGDSINWIRYVTHLKKLGAHVTVQATKELCRLYGECSFIDAVVEKPAARTVFGKLKQKKGEGLPEHDYIVAMGSLMYFFDPNLDSVNHKAYLEPKPEANEKVQKALGLIQTCKDKKVGIIWAGNPWHLNDRYRSCPLKYFKPLVIPGVQLFGLQLGNMLRSWPPGEKALWEGYDGEVNIVDLMEGNEVSYVDLSFALGDFNDTALLLQQLDLLVCVDTSVAHLAGALHVPIWVLLPKACEWRWQKDWYGSLRKYRQNKHGDWSELLSRVGEDLAKMVGLT